jgi:hypothetical protein
MLGETYRVVGVLVALGAGAIAAAIGPRAR